MPFPLCRISRLVLCLASLLPAIAAAGPDRDSDIRLPQSDGASLTLETEAMLTAWHARKGGDLLRVGIARAAPLGAKTGWKAAYPVVQWSGVL